MRVDLAVDVGRVRWQPRPETIDRVRQLVDKAGPADGVLEVVLTDDEYVHELNRRYRDKDRPTDVLSFSYLEAHETRRLELLEARLRAREFSDEPGTGEVLVGQVLISETSLRSRELRRDHSDDEEFVFLVAHGLLHTLGYDHQDEDESAEMHERQEMLLRACEPASGDTQAGESRS